LTFFLDADIQEGTLDAMRLVTVNCAAMISAGVKGKRT
jgi:hypothetical protein